VGAARFAGDASIHRQFGKLLIENCNDYGRAEREFLIAVRCAPESFAGYLGLAACYLERCSFGTVMCGLVEAVGSAAVQEQMLAAIAAQLLDYARYAEARECGHEIRARFPSHFMGLFALSKVAEAYDQDYDAAHRLLLACLKESNGNYSAYAAFIELLAKCRRWREAQQVFRDLYRRLNYSYPVFDHEAPNWDGSCLENKTILLDSVLATGFGDVIHYIRFARRLRDMGANVVVIARQGIEHVLAGVPGVSFASRRYDPRPRADYVIDILFLWLALDVTLENAGDGIPYIAADPVRIQAFRDRLDKRAAVNIGIVWESSEPRTRNPYIARRMPLAALEPLTRIDGARVFSIQVPASGPELDAAFGPGVVEDLGQYLHDFQDTAALVSALDLVVTVDTSTVHVAGALGRPALLMLASCGEWRWLASGRDSPWYATVRILRQDRPGDWSGVTNQVAAEIRRMVSRAGQPGFRESRPIAAREGTVSA